MVSVVLVLRDFPKIQSKIQSREIKNASQNNFQEGFNVLRTGIELYVIIN